MRVEHVGPADRKAADTAIGERRTQMDLATNVQPAVNDDVCSEQLVVRPCDANSLGQIRQNLRSLQR
jgi:hypothetical protein